jgi:hypothetical protein
MWVNMSTAKCKEVLIGFLLEIGELENEIFSMINSEDINGLSNWCVNNPDHQANIPVSVYKDGLRIQQSLNILKELEQDRLKSLFELKNRLQELTELIINRDMIKSDIIH